MKRSEMLNIIQTYIKCFEAYQEIPIEEKALRLLNRLECEGMKPPEYMKPIPFINGIQYPLVPGDFINKEGIWCTPGQQEWEPEDNG